ncbi:MAG: acyl-[acyl-carrier-protein] thioesterase [Burkholderiaceae bacterium]|nr:acyl-[acyl-carrier-protein] thioesterase [Burkholderiaceae bacterium]MEB2319679.1 hypothetical protein [Pseudomonadota bacterium]
MKEEAWRREAASYPLSGEMPTRYTDMDVWKHLNNGALISIHGEAVHHALRTLFGPQAWRDGEPVVGYLGSTTDFIAQAYYPDPLLWGARVVGIDERGLRIATALFQRGRCVSIHEALLTGWADGCPLALAPDQLAALRAAQTEGAEALAEGYSLHLDATAPRLAHFRWQRPIALRYGDSDARHLPSDAWLGRCAEQMRIVFLTEIRGESRRTRRGGMMIAHASLRWHRRDLPAAQWQMGCGIARLGERSVVVRGALFQDGVCLAECDSVMVFIDRETQRSEPLDDAARSTLEPWLLHAVPSALT